MSVVVVVAGKYAQVTNNPENDGCINAVLLVQLVMDDSNVDYEQEIKVSSESGDNKLKSHCEFDLVVFICEFNSSAAVNYCHQCM